MESHGLTGLIQVTERAHNILVNSFELEARAFRFDFKRKGW
jgi:hypothetical protein